MNEGEWITSLMNWNECDWRRKINEMKNNERCSEWKWKGNGWRWGNAQEWMNMIDKSKWDDKGKIKWIEQWMKMREWWI